MASPRLELKESKSEALNETQKKIIESFLQFPFEEIVEGLSAEIESESLIIHAYKAMITPIELSTIIPGLLTTCGKIFLEKEILTSIDTVRSLFRHPYPQNRRVGDPSAASGKENGIIDNEVYYWENGFGGILKHEPQGLLGLTAKNDSTALPVTKESVASYTIKLINQQIKLFEILGSAANEFNRIQFASSDKEKVVETLFTHKALASIYFSNINLIQDSEIFTSKNLKRLTDNIKYGYFTIAIMHCLKTQNILNSDNFDKLITYIQFSKKIVRESMDAPLTQVNFDRIIENCRQEMLASIFMGKHPRAGTGSSLYSIFVTDSKASRNSNGHVFGEVFKFI